MGNKAGCGCETKEPEQEQAVLVRLLGAVRDGAGHRDTSETSQVPEQQEQRRPDFEVS